MLEIRSKGDIPKEMKNPKWWIHKSLTDLFWFCSVILHHGKIEKYRDLNWIHKELCDFIDFRKNPLLRKLILMFRDSLKTSIAIAFIIQWFLRKCFYKQPGEIFLYAGVLDLVQKHLDRIVNEILNNELIQALFYKYIPNKKTEFDSCSIDNGLRFNDIWLDLGSPEKSLTGGHYEGGVNDNIMNEINSATFDRRKKTVRRWQEQRPLLIKGAWELIFETTWWPDDLSGILLNREGLFDFSKIRRKVAHRFMSEMGHEVFCCTARDEKGNPVFPEKADDEYLKNKKKEMGEYLYNSLYELQPVSEEEIVYLPKWLVHYEKLPNPFIRNLYVDCSGTKAKHSTKSALTLMDWGVDGRGYISYAHKQKLDPLELKSKILDVEQDSNEDGRPIYMCGIEKEKYGIFLADLLGAEDTRMIIRLVELKNLPRPTRLSSLIPHYQAGNILSKPGLTDYEREYHTYHLDKEREVDILDTIWGHFQIKQLPVKMEIPEFVPAIDDSFAAQVKRIREQQGYDLKQIARQF